MAETEKEPLVSKGQVTTVGISGILLLMAQNAPPDKAHIYMYCMIGLAALYRITDTILRIFKPKNGS